MCSPSSEHFSNDFIRSWRTIEAYLKTQAERLHFIYGPKCNGKDRKAEPVTYTMPISQLGCISFVKVFWQK